MKKFLVFGMMSALALAFAACSSDEEMTTPQLTGESVKTSFTFNIPNSKMGTRMTAGEAGETEVTDFSGIENIVLLPFAKSSDVTGEDVLALTPITLEAITEWTSNGSADKFNGKVYNDVTVPVGVNHFVFYGKRTGSNGEGELDATIPTEAGATLAEAAMFDMVPVTDQTVEDLGADADTGKDVLEALQGVSDAFATAIAAAEGTTASILTDLCAAFESNLAGSAASVNTLLADLKATLATVPGTDDIQDACVDLTSTFPAGLNLPDGAVGVQCSSDHKWAFAATNVNGLGQPELNTYVKPAELWYTVNTPIHVDPEKQEPNYDDQAEWADVVALYDAGTAVTSATRAIVLDNEIQFAVAQLKSRVIVDSTADMLQANDGTDGTDLVDVVAAADADFEVTAVLVGGQKNLDWAFLPAGDDEFVVYDAVQTGDGAVSTTASEWNYTLVGETAADEVKVLVELVNNGDAFYGYNDQLIPAGAKFYLLGTLKVSEATTANIDVVFKQDYTTIVTFKIGAASLKNAYNTIPDLRTPELELGLGVDLEWQDGLEFEGVVLGD